MKLFLLTWKKILLTIVFWFGAVALHNLVGALLGFEEAVFFIIAVIILPLYFLVSLVYTAIKIVKDRRK